MAFVSIHLVLIRLNLSKNIMYYVSKMYISSSDVTTGFVFIWGSIKKVNNFSQRACFISIMRLYTNTAVYQPM